MNKNKARKTLLDKNHQLALSEDKSEISWDKLINTFEPPDFIPFDNLMSKIPMNLKASDEMFSKKVSREKEGTYKIDLRPDKIVKVLNEWRISNPNLSELVKDPHSTYYFLEFIKSLGDTTYPLDSIPVRLHLQRMKKFLSGIKNQVLDIGCNSPNRSRYLFDKECQYIGCDPFLTEEFGSLVCCFAEELPFVESTFDACVFNTSLDHILDYQEAIKEAWRVTKNGGFIVISGYCWLDNASLLKDHVHFHHFRENQLSAALEPYARIEQRKAYHCPKGDQHRFVVYAKYRVYKNE